MNVFLKAKVSSSVSLPFLLFLPFNPSEEVSSLSEDLTRPNPLAKLDERAVSLAAKTDRRAA